MLINTEAYKTLNGLTNSQGQPVQLIAVSKTKPAQAVNALYQIGHRDFGENYVQELNEKQAILPKDINWHFIGHLQSNKVKYIAPYVYLIHSVDSFKLLVEINKQALKNNRIIKVLLQIYIANEETKYGFDQQDIEQQLTAANLQQLANIEIVGVMGMASFVDDKKQIEQEYLILEQIFNQLAQIKKGLNIKNINPSIISFGMSADYAIGLQHKANMIRIGSQIFGSRNYLPQ